MALLLQSENVKVIACIRDDPNTTMKGRKEIIGLQLYLRSSNTGYGAYSLS